ncbi:MAG TPA: hypothetical protein VGH94_10910, partial [Acidimicrobiales bacterium]
MIPAGHPPVGPTAGFSRRPEGTTSDTDPKDAGIDRTLLARVWTFARPYKRQLLGFLVLILAGAVLDLVPPLVFRSIIDKAIPAKDNAWVFRLGLLALGAVFLSTGLDLI